MPKSVDRDPNALPPRRSKARSLPRSTARLAVPSLAAASLLCLWLLLLIALRASDRVMPGTELLGQGLGGRRVESAAARIAERWAEHRIEIELGGDRVYLAPAALGVEIDAPASALAAWRVGRGPARGLASLSPLARRVVTPELRLDLDPAIASLRELADRHRRAPVDAGLKLEAGRAIALPATPGSEIDVMASSIRLQSELAAIVVDARFLPIERSIPALRPDAGPAADAVNALLARSLTVQLWDPVDDSLVARELAPGRWAEAFDVELGHDSRPLWMARRDRMAALTADLRSLDATRYAEADALIDALTMALNAGQVEARVRLRHRARQHAVESGETIASIGRRFGIPYPWIQAANPGLGDALRAGQVIEIPPADRFIDRPIVDSKRIVVDLGQQRVRVTEAGRQVWDWPVSTGIAESPTAPGSYQISSLEREAYASAWELSMPYFIGIYLPAPGATVTNGFHGLPVHDELGPLWGGLLGTRATYGCIMLDNPQAAQLFDWAEPGVIVEIRE